MVPVTPPLNVMTREAKVREIVLQGNYHFHISNKTCKIINFRANFAVLEFVVYSPYKLPVKKSTKIALISKIPVSRQLIPKPQL